MRIFRRSFTRSRSGEIILTGEGLSAGIGIGVITHMKSALGKDVPVLELQPGQLDREYERIIRAMDRVAEDLESVCREVENTLDIHTAGIFRAQQLMLTDESVRSDIHEELHAGLVNGEEVVRRVFRHYEERFRNAGSETVSARSDDVADIARRVILRMGGGALKSGTIPPGSIVVAERLFPSDTAVLPRHGIEGLVVEQGSRGSHLALLAREMGLPLVSGVPGVFAALPEGMRAIVDGDEGRVVLNPEAETAAAFKRRFLKGKEVQSRERWLRNMPVLTASGREIQILANISGPEDTKLALEYGARGIGLFRLENLYLSSSGFPTEDEIVGTLLSAVTPFRGQTVVIRLLDVGGDKRLPYLDLPVEANPFLGRRGVRLLLHFRELLLSELRGLVRVHREVPIQVLVPFVTFPEEVIAIRTLLDGVCEELGSETCPFVGAMIETPAAAVCAADIAEVSDFLSIGTNDLTQYALAADRDNPLVADYYRMHHPSITALVRIVTEQVNETPVSVCGELAGDVEGVGGLIGAGITTLSMAPTLIPHVKDRIRGLKV